MGMDNCTDRAYFDKYLTVHSQVAAKLVTVLSGANMHSFIM